MIRLEETDNALTDKGMGLSLRDSISNPIDRSLATLHPGQKYFAVDTRRLPSEAVVPDNMPPGHVSVFGLTPDQIRDAILPLDGDRMHGGRFR